LNVVGRSAVADAKFDTVMLREILDLPGINHTVHGFTVEGQQVREDARVAMVQQLAAQPTSSDAWLHINWYVGHTPQQVNATGGRVSELVVSSSQIETTIASTSIITTCRLCAAGQQLVEVDERAAATGRIEPGLYAAGWLRRGPVGASPTQRTDARELAEALAADLERDAP